MIKDFDVASLYPYQQSSIYVVQLKAWLKVGVYMPTGWNVYSVNIEIGEWIESQAVEHWNHGDEDHHGSRVRYCISPELETMFILRWS